jgi:hypothetical protein
MLSKLKREFIGKSLSPGGAKIVLGEREKSSKAGYPISKPKRRFPWQKIQGRSFFGWS